jgi:hypothetical protein
LCSPSPPMVKTLYELKILLKEGRKLIHNQFINLQKGVHFVPTHCRVNILSYLNSKSVVPFGFQKYVNLGGGHYLPLFFSNVNIPFPSELEFSKSTKYTYWCRFMWFFFFIFHCPNILGGYKANLFWCTLPILKKKMLF